MFCLWWNRTWNLAAWRSSLWYFGWTCLLDYRCSLHQGQDVQRGNRLIRRRSRNETDQIEKSMGKERMERCLLWWLRWADREPQSFEHLRQTREHWKWRWHRVLQQWCQRRYIFNALRRLAVISFHSPTYLFLALATITYLFAKTSSTLGRVTDSEELGPNKIGEELHCPTHQKPMNRGPKILNILLSWKRTWTSSFRWVNLTEDSFQVKLIHLLIPSIMLCFHSTDLKMEKAILWKHSTKRGNQDQECLLLRSIVSYQNTGLM